MIRKKRVSAGWITPLAIGLFGLFLLSCGGGGGSVAGGGIGGTGVTIASSGVITKIGSATVNGVKYETTGATLNTEADDNRTLVDLTEGMVVTIRGTVNADGITGTADSVSLADELEGPVTAVTETVPGATKVATVLGQTVIVQQSGVIGNMGTQFSGFSADTFAAFVSDENNPADGADVIEVSGFRRSDGSIVATYIEKKADNAGAFVGDDYEIEGIVAQPIQAGVSFSIDGLAILWNTSSVTEGQRVEVKGLTLNGNTLTAISVEVKTGEFGDGDEVELEGLVENLTATGFTLDGQTVDYSGATFKNGTAAALARDVRVEVEGTMQGTTLMAAEVRIEAQVELEGDVASKTSSSLVLAGFPTVTILVDATVTQFDGTAASLAQIAVNDHVHVHGQEPASGQVTASLIKTESGPKEDVILQGPARNPVDPNLDILGVTLDANDFSRRKTPSDGDATLAVFFNTLADGDIVMAGGTLSGTTITWNELEIEQ